MPQLTVPSLGSRAFALECLLLLVDTLSVDPEQSIPKAVDSTRDLLIDHVQSLVRCSFAVAEGKVETLRVCLGDSVVADVG